MGLRDNVCVVLLSAGVKKEYANYNLPVVTYRWGKRSLALRGEKKVKCLRTGCSTEYVKLRGKSDKRVE
jgi:hypothetical protein